MYEIDLQVAIKTSKSIDQVCFLTIHLHVCKK